MPGQLNLVPGTRVYWGYRPRGGHGREIPVAAVVVSVGCSTVLIECSQRILGKSKRVRRRVKQNRLSLRKARCFQLGEL